MINEAEIRARKLSDWAADWQSLYPLLRSSVPFFRDGKPVRGQYVDDGYEILTYESGNQGVRFIFKKSGGDEAAPQFIQFSDHKLVPTKVDHYHLYWGDDRAELLKEVTNWPTYFFAELSGAEIAAKMLAH